MTKVPEVITALVDQIVKNGRTRVVSVCESPKFEGYMSKMYFVTLRDDEGRKKENQLHLVVKLAPFEKSCRLESAVRENFSNEYYFYQEVWPAFQKLQKDFLGKIFVDIAPRCYLAQNDEYEEKIVLEDLKQKGYEVFNKKQIFGRKHMRLIFESYGRFHSLSFACKARYPDQFYKMSSKFQEVYVKIHPKLFREQLMHTYQQCWEFFAEESDAKLKEKLKKYCRSVETFFECLGPEEKYSVLAHGDCWSNNLMFKSDDCLNPIDIKFIDFQAMNARSPVNDLSYCFYSGGCGKHFKDLDIYLKIYHRSLSEMLLQFGLDAKVVYPYEVLKSDWKRYSKFGYSMALLLLKCKLAYDGLSLELPDIMAADGSIKEMEASRYDAEEYRERSKVLVMHMYENDFL